MGNFLSRIVEIEDEAKAEILKMIPKGLSLALISEEDLDNGADEFYDLPICYRVGKHGDYCEYGIIGVKHTEEGGLLFSGFGKGEDWGDEYEFDTSEISTGFLSELADFIVDK